MYPLYFYICLLFSVASVVVLILLAIFPINLPFVAKTTEQIQPFVRQRKARSPTNQRHINYWNFPWDDDDKDL